MDSKLYKENFQLFADKMEVNLGKENDAEKFEVFSQIHFCT